MDRYLLISSDGHAGPPAHIYREYLDPLEPLVDRIGPTLEEVHGEGVELPAPTEAIA